MIVLGMVFCLMVFIAYSYKMIPLINNYMSKLALKDVLLMRVPLHCGTGD